jgi:hypothetical protein
MLSLSKGQCSRHLNFHVKSHAQTIFLDAFGFYKEETKFHSHCPDSASLTSLQKETYLEKEADHRSTQCNILASITHNNVCILRKKRIRETM